MNYAHNKKHLLRKSSAAYLDKKIMGEKKDLLEKNWFALFFFVKSFFKANRLY